MGVCSNKPSVCQEWQKCVAQSKTRTADGNLTRADFDEYIRIRTDLKFQGTGSGSGQYHPTYWIYARLMPNDPAAKLKAIQAAREVGWTEVQAIPSMIYCPEHRLH